MTQFPHTGLAMAFSAAMLAAPIAAAQEAPSMPVPNVTTQAPLTAQPAASDISQPEAPTSTVSDDSATDGQTPDTPDTAETTAVAPALPMPLPLAAEDDNAAEAQGVSPMPDVPLSRQEELTEQVTAAYEEAMVFLRDGGPSIWAIAALSVITLALILWKIWRLALIGAWSRGKSGKALAAFEAGQSDAALALVKGRLGVRSQVVATAIIAIETLPEDRAREETARVAKLNLARASTGLGALELIATIAPLLGLLGTVLGMIAAFQALQAAGSKADPALLAGGIWEALLTTAAGMAVAIPASAALTWFEAVIGRMRRDVEDSATRLFVAATPAQIQIAAE